MDREDNFEYTVIFNGISTGETDIYEEIKKATGIDIRENPEEYRIVSTGATDNEGLSETIYSPYQVIKVARKNKKTEIPQKPIKEPKVPIKDPIGGTGGIPRGPIGGTDRIPKDPIGGTDRIPRGPIGGTDRIPKGPIGEAEETAKGPIGEAEETTKGPIGEAEEAINDPIKENDVPEKQEPGKIRREFEDAVLKYLKKTKDEEETKVVRVTRKYKNNLSRWLAALALILVFVSGFRNVKETQIKSVPITDEQIIIQKFEERVFYYTLSPLLQNAVPSYQSLLPLVLLYRLQLHKHNCL